MLESSSSQVALLVEALESPLVEVVESSSSQVVLLALVVMWVLVVGLAQASAVG